MQGCVKACKAGSKSSLDSATWPSKESFKQILTNRSKKTPVSSSDILIAQVGPRFDIHKHFMVGLECAKNVLIKLVFAVALFQAV